MSLLLFFTLALHACSKNRCRKFKESDNRAFIQNNSGKTVYFESLNDNSFNYCSISADSISNYTMNIEPSTNDYVTLEKNERKNFPIRFGCWDDFDEVDICVFLSPFSDSIDRCDELKQKCKKDDLYKVIKVSKSTLEANNWEIIIN